MATVIRVCPGCGVTVLIKMPEHVYQQYHYGCPIDELDYDFSEREKSKLDTGMCDDCHADAMEAINDLLQGDSNG